MASASTKGGSAARAARIAVTTSLIIIAVAGGTSTASRAQTTGASAIVVKATSTCFDSVVRFTGVVVPRAEAAVNFNLEGYEISDVLVGEGDTVTADQALVKLTRLSSTGGSPASAGGGQTPPSGSAAASGAAPQQPATMTLTAPAAGLVSKSTAKIGAVAAAVPLPPPMGQGPLFRIIVGNKLEIEADIATFQLPKIETGQRSHARLENGRDVNATVRTILPEINPNTQLGKVRLTLDSDPAIRAGMFASGAINASHSCGGVSIPRAAVQYETQGGATVQVVRDNTVETRHVRLGLFTDTDIEVQDGVRAGDLVIANAGTSLHDGDKVNPTFADDAGQ
jgi:multidrug efflux pump subunit AcrA (membrane-fusion protein)